MITDIFPITVDGESVQSERSLLLDVEDGDKMKDFDSVKYIVIHCTDTRSTQNYTAPQLIRDHKARGFRTGGYHFYIRRDGTRHQFRALLEVGAHCRPWNRCSIGICYEGGRDADGNFCDTRTTIQKQVMLELLQLLTELFPKAQIRGHRDMPGTTPKECPCFDAQTEYKFLTDRKRKKKETH